MSKTRISSLLCLRRLNCTVLTFYIHNICVRQGRHLASCTNNKQQCAFIALTWPVMTA